MNTIEEAKVMDEKKKATPKVMRTIGQDYLECKVCGAKVLISNLRVQAGGKFPRGSWQCPYGCKVEDAKEGAA